ncbi:MAG: NADH-quinone oxidoreductase subunit D [bacterium]
MIVTETTQFLNMGPQHPSTHGVFRMMLQLDGERVVKCQPHLGYLHRGIEKLAEKRLYPHIIPLTDRLHYVNAFQNELTYCLAVEDLMGIEVPRRAQYIRVMLAELSRIQNHMIFFGALGMDLGALTPFFYGFKDRETILGFFEEISGARLTFNYMRFGGLKADLPDGVLDRIYEFTGEIPSIVDEYDNLFSGNEIFQARMKGISILSKDLAINLGITGPVLRSTGIPFDLRKDDPYSSYEEFDFSIPTGKIGDNLDRYTIRLQEIMESNKIVRQAIERMPSGQIAAKVPRVVKIDGEGYFRTETSLGEQGVYIIGNGNETPYRVKFRSPAFVNLQMLQYVLPGVLIADVIATFSTIDICMGEVDR